MLNKRIFMKKKYVKVEITIKSLDCLDVLNVSGFGDSGNKNFDVDWL